MFAWIAVSSSMLCLLQEPGSFHSPGSFFSSTFVIPAIVVSVPVFVPNERSVGSELGHAFDRNAWVWVSLDSCDLHHRPFGVERPIIVNGSHDGRAERPVKHLKNIANADCVIHALFTARAGEFSLTRLFPFQAYMAAV